MDEFIPSTVNLKPKDMVKFTTTTKWEVHTVTFPKGTTTAHDIFPVCENGSAADTPASGPPPTFGCANQAAVEGIPQWTPEGTTIIKDATTMSNSGVMAAGWYASTYAAANPQQVYTTTFPTNSSTTYTYECMIHAGMTGQVLAAAVAQAPAALAQTGAKGLKGYTQPTQAVPPSAPFLPWAGLAVVLLTALCSVVLVWNLTSKKE
jgi:plastocyanin